MVVAKHRMRVRFLPYDSKNGGNAPPQKSITARASCCSDRDCDFASENKLNASVPPNDHPRDQKVPCLFIPIFEALRLCVKGGQESADTLAPGEVIFSFSFQPGKFLIRFFVSLVQHRGTGIELFCRHTRGSLFPDKPAVLLDRCVYFFLSFLNLLIQFRSTVMMEPFFSEPMISPFGQARTFRLLVSVVTSTPPTRS